MQTLSFLIFSFISCRPEWTTKMFQILRVCFFFPITVLHWTNTDSSLHFFFSFFLSLVVVSFPLVDDPQTCLLAWTTTPWTLPSNLALCVHPDFDYVTVLDKVSGKRFVVLQSRLNFLYKSEDEYQVTNINENRDETKEILRFLVAFEIVTMNLVLFSDFIVTAWSVVAERQRSRWQEVCSIVQLLCW